MRRIVIALFASVVGAVALAYGTVSVSTAGGSIGDQAVAAPVAVRRTPTAVAQTPVTVSPAAVDRQRRRILPAQLPPALLLDVGATLSVCILEGGACSGDMAVVYKQPKASIPADATSKVRKLYWSTTSPAVTGGLLQLSPVPFNNAWPAPAGTFSRRVDTLSFLVDFGATFGNDRIEKLTAAGMVNKNYTAQATRNMAPPSRSAIRDRVGRTRVSDAVLSRLAAQQIPNTAGFVYRPTWFARVVPLNGERVAGAPTNEVVVAIVPPEKPGSFTFYVPPKIYDVRIKEFQPVRDPDKGVCPHAMILDTDYIVKVGTTTTTVKKAGDQLCPPPFKGIGEKPWYEQLWDALKSGLNWVSQAYNKLKSAVVDAVGGLVCAGDATCTSLLSAGLDIGLAAMGLPPSIPNFDQLVDGGFDYLAGELAAQAGCPDTLCKDAIKTGLKTALEKTKNTNPGCAGTEEAHAMGIEPLCLPAGVTAHLDPAGTLRTAQVVLEVKRNFVDGDSNTAFHVYWTNYGFNAGPVGGVITNIEPYGKTLQIAEPLEGPVFVSKDIRIPPLAKGQSIDIPIGLTAGEYWVPGHKELMEGWSTVTFKDGWPQYQYDDWWKLYFGASVAMSVSIDGCPGMHNYTPSCIISSDTAYVTLPMTRSFASSAESARVLQRR